MLPCYFRGTVSSILLQICKIANIYCRYLLTKHVQIVISPYLNCCFTQNHQIYNDIKCMHSYIHVYSLEPVLSVFLIRLTMTINFSEILWYLSSG